jgi:hypothetical protein
MCANYSMLTTCMQSQHASSSPVMSCLVTPHLVLVQPYAQELLVLVGNDVR